EDEVVTGPRRPDQRRRLRRLVEDREVTAPGEEVVQADGEEPTAGQDAALDLPVLAQLDGEPLAVEVGLRGARDVDTGELPVLEEVHVGVVEGARPPHDVPLEAGGEVVAGA